MRCLPCWGLLTRAWLDSVLELRSWHVQGLKRRQHLHPVSPWHVPGVGLGFVMRAVPSRVICKHIWAVDL